jgi:hypothetical protein
MLRSPSIAELVIKLGAAQFGSGSLPAIDRELAILATGVRFDSCYELSQHEKISASVGVTSAQRAAVVVKKWDCPDLSESQQALLAFVAAVADGPTVPDEIFGAVQRWYREQQIVEAVILTGYYFLSRESVRYSKLCKIRRRGTQSCVLEWPLIQATEGSLAAWVVPGAGDRIPGPF